MLLNPPDRAVSPAERSGGASTGAAALAALAARVRCGVDMVPSIRNLRLPHLSGRLWVSKLTVGAQSANASIGGQAQTRLRSPKALSTRLTGGQYLWLISERIG